MDHPDSAKRHRYQAEECRAKAELMSDPLTRESYLKMASAYEVMADNEEVLAQNAIPKSKAAE